MKPAVPQATFGPETSVAARRTFGRSSEEISSAGLFPQPLARQAWGRCLAVSMKTVYSVIAAWHPVGFSVWVVSHSFIRVVGPSTILLHPGREAAVGPQLLIRREIPAYLAAGLYI